MNLPLTKKAGYAHVVINQKKKQSIPLAEIVMCEGFANYTLIYMSNGRKIVSAHTLKLFEVALNESGFTRIHRAYLINYQHYKNFNRDTNLVLMKNGIELNVSRRRLNAFRNVISKNT